MQNVFAIALAAALATAASSQQQAAYFAHFAGFELGQETLAGVQKVLGPSHRHETGDAGEYEAWVCYQLPNGQVEFNSGEMGGGTDLLGVTVSLHGKDRDCPPWPQTVPAPELQIGGIRLGISALAFEKAVKAPVEWRGNVASANFRFQRAPSDAELLALPAAIRTEAESKHGSVMLDVAVTVEGTFAHGRLVKLTTWKIETY